MTARRANGGKKGSGKPSPPEPEPRTTGSKAKDKVARPSEVSERLRLTILAYYALPSALSPG